jgi:Ca2+/Na+ antiporter
MHHSSNALISVYLVSGCFGFFAGIVFVATFAVYLYLPETANRTITEIDEEYKNHKAEFPRKKWV